MLKKKLIRHLLLPSLAPALLVGLYFTPKYVFGCATTAIEEAGKNSKKLTDWNYSARLWRVIHR